MEKLQCEQRIGSFKNKEEAAQAVVEALQQAIRERQAEDKDNLEAGVERLSWDQQEVLDVLAKKPKAKIKSMELGVSWHRGNSKWKATLSIGGKQYHLGLVDTEEEASAKYKERAEAKTS